MNIAVPAHDVGRTVEELIAAHRSGFSMTADFYKSPEVFARDMERIAMRAWLYAGHVSRIPNTGDFFLFKVGNEEVIVTRTETGDVAALLNVCRHRGSRVCLEPCGSARAFVCRYHAWTYSLDGSLRSKHAMGKDFDPKEYGLKTVACRILHGLIFVNFTGNDAAFDVIENALSAAVAPFALAETKVAERIVYSIEANWKLAVENYLECYHCGPAHPEYAEIHTRKLGDEAFRKHTAELFARSRNTCLPEDSLDTGYAAEPWGAEYFYSRAALFPDNLSGSEDGKTVAPLLGTLTEHDGGTVDLMIGPVAFLLVYTDHAVVYSFVPRDVQLCDMEVTWLVRGDAEEGEDYDRDRLKWMWDVTSIADKRIIVNNQLGVNSRFYEPGPFSEMEAYTDAFVHWYLKSIA